MPKTKKVCDENVQKAPRHEAKATPQKNLSDEAIEAFIGALAKFVVEEGLVEEILKNKDSKNDEKRKPLSEKKNQA